MMNAFYRDIREKVDAQQQHQRWNKVTTQQWRLTLFETSVCFCRTTALFVATNHYPNSNNADCYAIIKVLYI